MSNSPYPPGFENWPLEKRNKWFSAQAAAYREAAVREAVRLHREAKAPAPVVHLPIEQHAHWPAPKPLPDGLLPVAAFNEEFLPESLRPWVMDIADRMQCAPEFVAVPVVVACGSLIGCKIGIRPQRNNDWTEVPNLWGCEVGRPGVLKSPAMEEAIRPLRRFEVEELKKHEAALREYQSEAALAKIRNEEAAKAARQSIKGGAAQRIDFAPEPEVPKARCYLTNDTSYESLGEILSCNPQGVLVFRDELVSLLKTLDREEFAAARGFYLTAWNGTGGYTFDRIIRGRTHIERACLSLLGSTQPGKLAEYIRRANEGGAGDDGLIQRFGLLVWPDQTGDWKEVDRYPDSEAKRTAWETFKRLDQLTPETAGAQRDDSDCVPFLRFDPEAQALFSDWQVDFEKKLRSGELSPALESHLAKYRKLVPALALINHLIDNRTGPVSEAAILQAIVFSEYLETHARRAYGSGLNSETAAAKAILKHIRRGELKDGFTLRDAMRNDWSGLTSRSQVQAGLDLLCDFGWLRAEKIETGGRPATTYAINPGVLQ
jgi:hypothetical protein